MDTVQINWAKGAIRFDEISTSKEPYLDKEGFYAILGATFYSESKSWKDFKLLYIGQAFNQTLRQRIPQDHPGYECVSEYRKKNRRDIIVMVGIIGQAEAQRITQQLFDDVECCLIYCNQPFCNVKCKDSYTGRDLQVINTGDFSPLKEKCACSP